MKLPSSSGNTAQEDRHKAAQAASLEHQRAMATFTEAWLVRTRKLRQVACLPSIRMATPRHAQVAGVAAQVGAGVR